MKTPKLIPALINTKLLWFVTTLGMIGVVALGMRSSSHRLSDFVGYYTAAKVVATGDSLSSLYDDAFFVDKVRAIAPNESTFVMYVNPPAVSFLVLPLHTFDPFTAKQIWNSVSMLLIAVAFFLGCKYLHVPLHSPSAPLFFGLLACTLPFFRNLQRGQVYVLMLVLVLTFLIGYREKNPWLTGIPLSLLLLLKYFGWMFLILFLVERRWRELSVTLFSLLVGFCVTLMVTGSETYVAHLQYLLAVFGGSDFATTGLPSIQALFGALFVGHFQFNPNPIANIPWIAQAFTILVLISSLCITMRSTLCGDIHHENRLLSVLILSVVFTPLAADHHYMLIIPAAFVMIPTIFDSPLHWRATILMLALLYALLGWYPSLQIAQFDGLGKLYCFPRLYAAIGLWLFLVLQRRPEDLRAT